MFREKNSSGLSDLRSETQIMISNQGRLAYAKSAIENQPDHAQGSPAKRVRVFRSRRLLIDRPEADERIELVGQRDRNAHRISRHAIGRPLRLVVLLARGSDGSV